MMDEFNDTSAYPGESYMYLARKSYDEGDQEACTNWLVQMIKGVGIDEVQDRLIAGRLLFLKHQVWSGAMVP